MMPLVFRMTDFIEKDSSKLGHLIKSREPTYVSNNRIVATTSSKMTSK